MNNQRQTTLPELQNIEQEQVFNEDIQLVDEQQHYHNHNGVRMKCIGKGCIKCYEIRSNKLRSTTQYQRRIANNAKGRIKIDEIDVDASLKWIDDFKRQKQVYLILKKIRKNATSILRDTESQVISFEKRWKQVSNTIEKEINNGLLKDDESDNDHLDDSSDKGVKCSQF